MLVKVILIIDASIILLINLFTSKSGFTWSEFYINAFKIGIPTTLILLILDFYNKRLWKYPVFNKLINMPNIQGSYYGQLVSSFKDSDRIPIIKDCVIEIKQTGSDFSIFGYYACDDEESESSFSRSISYSVVSTNNDNLEITYLYENIPKKERDKYSKLNYHKGTSLLMWDKTNPNIIFIEYYNKDRNSKGKIELLKNSTQLKGKFYRPN